ncbi:MAG: hypothetical protein P9M14_14170 [Candidatus Alcyoniella australis]|nr:hypothetical protein [Candidatus Alcyoniella australis]
MSRRASALLVAALAASCLLAACEYDYNGGGQTDDHDDYTPPDGSVDGACDVHQGDRWDEITITSVSGNFAHAGENSEVEVSGEYVLHSRDNALIHPLSCSSSSEVVPALAERGSGQFCASYTIHQIDDPQQAHGCLLVLVYSLESEKLISCRFEIPSE